MEIRKITGYNRETKEIVPPEEINNYHTTIDESGDLIIGTWGEDGEWIELEIHSCELSS